MFSPDSTAFFTQLAIGSSALSILLLIAVTVRHHFDKKQHFLVLSKPPELVSASGLGKLEIGAEELREILIICHKIEKPSNELLSAVRHNLANGRSYKFFVSQSNFEAESKAYFKIFQAIAEVEGRLNLSGKNSISDLVELHSLTFDWHDKPPIVFYRTGNPESPRTVAYRGHTAGEGIDNLYRLVDPYLGHAILEMLKTMVEPETNREDIKPEEFLDNNVVKFTIPNARSNP